MSSYDWQDAINLDISRTLEKNLHALLWELPYHILAGNTIPAVYHMQILIPVPFCLLSSCDHITAASTLIVLFQFVFLHIPTFFKHHQKFQHKMILYSLPPETVTITTIPYQVGVTNFRCSYYSNKPDSTTITDCWKAQSRLSMPGY